MSVKFIDHGGFDVSQCLHCKHARAYNKCAAFPDGAPKAILENDHDHRLPFPGDNGIRFEPLFEDEPVKEEWFTPFRKQENL